MLDPAATTGPLAGYVGAIVLLIGVAWYASKVVREGWRLRATLPDQARVDEPRTRLLGILTDHFSRGRAGAIGVGLGAMLLVFVFALLGELIATGP
jgi:hypothetical protein